MEWIAGLDEVGMGALAGPIVIAVTAFSPDKQPPDGIGDSKALSENKRIDLFGHIIQHADWLGFGHADAWDIDQLGVAEAWQLAARKALFGHPEFHLLIDGVRKVRGFAGSQKTIIKGDALHWQISAASIVAKTLRDREMRDLSLFPRYSRYNWSENVGYGTKEHYRGLSVYGPTDQHRQSFLKKLKPASQQR